jgi:hypothetical protein
MPVGVSSSYTFLTADLIKSHSIAHHSHLSMSHSWNSLPPAHYYLWQTRPPPTLLYNTKNPIFPPFQHPHHANCQYENVDSLFLWNYGTHIDHVCPEDHWLNTQVPVFCNCIPQPSLPWKMEMAYSTETLAPMYIWTQCDTLDDRTIPSSRVPLLAKSYSVVLKNPYKTDVSSDISSDVSYKIWCHTQNLFHFQRKSVPNSTTN